MVFLKEFFKKLILKKKSERPQKKHEKGKELVNEVFLKCLITAHPAVLEISNCPLICSSWGQAECLRRLTPGQSEILEIHFVSCRS